MRITWYGHAAFRIETGGLSIILDPYRSPDCGGYEPVGDAADVVVVSHENDRYHSHLGQIRPPFQVIRGLEVPPEGRSCGGITFQFERVFESPERLPEDEVTIIHFRAEGLHVVSLGDLGHTLSAEELAPFNGADVVLVAAGGPPTIALMDIPPLLDAIEARWVVPMHYKTPKIDLNIQPIERFLELFPTTEVDRPGRCWFEATASELPDSMRILILEHAR